MCASYVCGVMLQCTYSDRRRDHHMEKRQFGASARFQAERRAVLQRVRAVVY